MAAVDARRNVNRTLSELAAEYGHVEVVRERKEVEPGVYDRLRERSAAFDGCGGAGAWVRDPEGRVLLVDTGEGWAEPAAPRRPEQDHLSCAEEAIREATGIAPVMAGLSHVHVRYVDDWSDRDPLPQPFVVFEARAVGEPAGDAAWHARLPEELLYDHLRELSLDG
jgi:hypothetical protein